jgi:hypothetical protein
MINSPAAVLLLDLLDMLLLLALCRAEALLELHKTCSDKMRGGNRYL